MLYTQDCQVVGGAFMHRIGNLCVSAATKPTPHMYDDSNLADVPSDDGSGTIHAKTTWTALLYLTSATDGVVGGETVFYPHDRKSAREELVIAPETGMLLLHKHGDNCLLHEGREVMAGENGLSEQISVYVDDCKCKIDNSVGKLPCAVIPGQPGNHTGRVWMQPSGTVEPTTPAFLTVLPGGKAVLGGLR
uniref:Uncharacterized protein n=1 Tax=Lasiodiplodia mahajangana TaxID=1108764 RepID=A0ACC2JR31_9PEZI